MTDPPVVSPGDVEEAEAPFRYTHSASFAALLQELGASLLVSTYQAGKLVVFRAAGERLSALLRSFEQVMGLAVKPGHLAIGTRAQIWLLTDAPDIAAQLSPPGRHDACFLPRRSYVTGDIRVHDLAWGRDALWFVNTRFSCLCTLHDDYSFEPRWRPPFVTALAAEDRCHLNGLALVDGQPKYVTTLGATDEPQGWRANKAAGGCLLDIDREEPLLAGLSMPHSPRVHAGELWFLDSGTGRLALADRSRGAFTAVAELPGYTRGLALARDYAFVGLSKIRETSTFGGLPIADRAATLKCGIWVVHIPTGKVVAELEFSAGVEEIYDVQLLTGARYPAVIGLEKDAIQNTFVIPRNMALT